MVRRKAALVFGPAPLFFHDVMTSTQTSIHWQRVGSVAPTQLAEARETLHHAAQLLALVGASYIPARADDSHTSMIWLDDREALATQVVDAARPFRVALRVVDLTMLMLDVASAEPAVFPLAGRTRDEAIAWLRARIGDAGGNAADLRTSLHFSIADHPTDHGAQFVRHSDALVELGRWYANAAAVLDARREQTPAAGEVRCWPHHFDIATLVTTTGGALQTIGTGMSPGDASYGEPYFYVAPYPRPPSALPPLAIGDWHTEDWFGAVLRGSEIVQLSETDQRVLVSRFTELAYSALTVG